WGKMFAWTAAPSPRERRHRERRGRGRWISARGLRLAVRADARCRPGPGGPLRGGALPRPRRDGRGLRGARPRASRARGADPVADRMLVAGQYHDAAGELDPATAIYRSLFAVSPTEFDYGLRLAHVQNASERWTEARATVAALRALPGAADDPRLDLEEGDSA